MPPHVRLPSAARDRGKALITAGADRVNSAVQGRKKSLLYVSAALALAGAGTASAATVASTGTATPLANAPVSASVSTGGAAHSSPLPLATSRAASPAALTAPHAVAAAGRHTAVARAVVRHPATAHPAGAKQAAASRGTAKHTPARHTPARHPAPARAAGRRPHGMRPASSPHRASAARRPAAAARRHAPARTARPYLIYDSVTPGAIPAHHLVATYATGGYAVPAAQVAGRRVLWIDTNGSDPHASALDIEPGDATPTMAAGWVRAKLTADPHALARLYTMQSDWPAVQAAVATLPPQMRAQVRYWIADPTGYPHMVPGADATQWYWGSSYDITTATPRF